MLAITFTREAAKALKRMPANVAATIRAKIEHYATDPDSLANNVKTLKGSNGLRRLRIGDWRVIFTENGEVLAILKIAPRGEAYE
ncbi:type II toxin-antitoxin system RelE family toxin [Rhodomicrobium lacus]|uniref:type II toxin-antitoxin system RelE family toxin n=1 Tax=Rhodomicrobium lacus TaxID=2498452 RepID=UPI000F8D0CE0|nr:type II toxin-antitoxin system RelE/ParE family toxin [Rhodomicrobium lacus]